MNDFQTTQQLYVLAINQDSNDIIIQPNDPNNKTDTSTLPIDKLAMIIYSNKEGAKCDNSLFQMSLIKTEIWNETMFYGLIRQNLHDVMDDQNKIYDIYLNITLLSDNSIYFYWGMSEYVKYQNTPTSIYDRNFSQFKNIDRKLNLEDILTINEPFSIEINSPQDSTKILWSTKNQIQFLSGDFHIFNFIQPSSNSKRFFGLQERKGNFFLQDNYVYSIFSNNNNVDDLQQANGRVIQHGRNGAYPVIFSQFQDSSNLIAFVSFNPSGTDFLFNEQNSRITQVSSLTLVEFLILFDQTPEQTSIALQNHIKLGNLLKIDQSKPVFPPPAYTFGWFPSLNGVTTLKEVADLIKVYNSILSCPTEGLILDLGFLQDFESFTINKDKLLGIIEDLQIQHMVLFQAMKSGFSIYEQSKYLDFINKNKTYVTQYSGFIENLKPIVGQDETGHVLYVDYSFDNTDQLLSMMMNDYENTYQITKYGVISYYNEIHDVYCSGQCDYDDQSNIDKWMLYKTGTDFQRKNSLYYKSLRILGPETILHNLNGLMENIAFKNAIGDTKKSMFSSSTALGSGKLGNVGRMIDYIDFTDNDISNALSIIQSLSILGMPTIGYSVQQNTGTGNEFLHEKLGSMLPIFSESILQFHHNRTFYQEITRQRYMLLYYTRTQIFKQLNYGIPFIKPLFYEFPQDDNTYNEVKQQYMFGPNLKVAISGTDQIEDSQYFPQGRWCSIYYFSKNSDCINVDQGKIVEQPKSYIYMKQGTITPMKNPYGNPDKTNMVYTTGDLDLIRMDLHILLDYNSLDVKAAGELLIDNPIKDDLNFCYIKMSLQGNSLTFEKASKELGGTDSCVYSGFQLGDLVIYAPNDFTFNEAKVNDNEQLFEIETGITNVVFFRLSSLNLTMDQLDKVIFQ